jgi:high-affinity iron transporter
VLAALIIVFREVFEAGLIVGIVMAVTRGVPFRGWWIAGGVGGGALAACVVAMFTGALAAAFEGSGQEIFNAAILSLAAAMLAWHNIWMARHGATLAAEMRAAGQAVLSGASSLAGLAIVVAVAVLREGVEVVLFLYGIVASEGGSGFAVFAGGVGGLVLGALVCVLTYRGLLKIPTRYLFGATSLLIAFLAAGMAAQATLFLEQANLVTRLGTIVWDSSWILPDKSLIGRALHTLIGYIDQPTAMELLVYLATLAAILILMKVLAPLRPAKEAVASRA